MKIAIDLNDVIRDYSNNFVKYYIEGYDREYDLSDFEIWSCDMSAVLPFRSDRSYQNFMYNDYAFELYGKCPTCGKSLPSDLCEWMEVSIPDIDEKGEIEIMYVSPKEYGLSIGSTYFFISKLGTKVREVYLPSEMNKIWERCDVLITANPDLLLLKPHGKISVRIETDYNKDAPADRTYRNMKAVCKDNNFIEELLKRNEMSEK